ncbi:MAG: NAD(P)/FAD-dependent oxidoreductase [Candidatus Thorarchaeota archaeon]
MKIVVVGYGPGGAAAALAGRMFNSEADITIVTQETLESHRKPGASLALEIPDTNELAIKNWSWDALSKKRIEVLPGTTVTPADSKLNSLQINGPEGSSTLDYDSLILATGGIPNVPSIPGTDLPGVFTIQTMADTSEIGKQLSGMSKVVIVGAGFSGLETAERLVSLGKDTHLIVRSRLMRRQLEESMSAELMSRLPTSLTIHKGESPTSVFGDGKVAGLSLGDNKLDVDAVLFMTGVKPNVELAKQLGIKIGSLGGIVIDERMQTSEDGIYAVGDCVEVIDSFTKKPLLLPVGSVAARAGRQAGVAAVGGKKIYEDTSKRLQYDRIFGTDIVCIGHSSTTAEDMGVKTTVQYINDTSEFAKVALVTDSKGQLIGGQVITSRMGARLGYEIFDRVESGAILQDKPLLKPRHERLRDYLETTFGPIR